MQFQCDQDETPEEHSHVEELNSSTQATVTITTTSETTTSPAHLHPCADQGGCSQQCTAVAGRAYCSCFPGFSLMTDRRTCKGKSSKSLSGRMQWDMDREIGALLLKGIQSRAYPFGYSRQNYVWCPLLMPAP
ncbi:hypothetical protein AMECASPLE_009625 [Ameca splendens]|uniref:EGF-like domain-containing protein n=1 Tax=Ameca splendens TaxID=208324 RepID=A0ABV0Z934_9TELE